MVKRIAILILLVTLFILPVHGQDTVHIASLRVDIWPEFDRPAVLVIYHIYLVPKTPLPAVLNLRIPQQAIVNAVAVEEPSLGLLIADYSKTISGDWVILSITATTYTIQVEYYDVLIKNGISRQIKYEWLGDASVDAFSIGFQNPVGAVNVDIEPAPVSSQRDQYNLLNYETETVSLAEGETYIFNVSYEKADAELSVANLPVEPAIPLDETDGQVTWSDVLPWLLGSLGLVLIALGILVLFGFPGKAEGENRKRKRPLSKHLLKDTNGERETPLNYCKECGHRTETNDQFCRSCGIRL